MIRKTKPIERVILVGDKIGVIEGLINVGCLHGGYNEVNIEGFTSRTKFWGKPEYIVILSGSPLALRRIIKCAWKSKSVTPFYSDVVSESIEPFLEELDEEIERDWF